MYPMPAQRLQGWLLILLSLIDPPERLELPPDTYLRLDELPLDVLVVRVYCTLPMPPHSEQMMAPAGRVRML